MTGCRGAHTRTHTYTLPADPLASVCPPHPPLPRSPANALCASLFFSPLPPSPYPASAIDRVWWLMLIYVRTFLLSEAAVCAPPPPLQRRVHILLGVLCPCLSLFHPVFPSPLLRVPVGRAAPPSLPLLPHALRTNRDALVFFSSCVSTPSPLSSHHLPILYLNLKRHSRTLARALTQSHVASPPTLFSPPVRISCAYLCLPSRVFVCSDGRRTPTDSALASERARQRACVWVCVCVHVRVPRDAAQHLMWSCLAPPPLRHRLRYAVVTASAPCVPTSPPCPSLRAPLPLVFYECTALASDSLSCASCLLLLPPPSVFAVRVCVCVCVARSASCVGGGVFPKRRPRPAFPFFPAAPGHGPAHVSPPPK